jgi:hypothetical protein
MIDLRIDGNKFPSVHPKLSIMNSKLLIAAILIGSL